MNFVVLFFREEGFYPVELLDPEECGVSVQQQVRDHVALNPGTLRVETVFGNVLYPEPAVVDNSTKH